MELKISDILQQTFSEKQKKNSLYSIRAFARDLEIGKSTLHDVIYKNKEVSQPMASKILQKLGYGFKEIDQIINYNFYPEKDDLYKELSDKEFKTISTSYHFGLLSTARLGKLKASPEVIKKYFGINKEKANKILTDLLDLNLIYIDEKNLIQRSSRSLRTSYDIKSETIQNFHRETLNQIQVSISEINVELREIASSTFLMNPQKIKELKEELKSVRRKLVQSVETTNEEGEPYLMNFSLIPLSKRSLDAC